MAGVPAGSSLDTSLPASAGEVRQSRKDEAMGLKLSLPVLQVRRSLTLAGRKLASREDGGVMASGNAWVLSSKNYLPKCHPLHGSLVPLAAPLPQGSQSCSNRALAH